jgi:predicted transcriptional regulator of viral defense system
MKNSPLARALPNISEALEHFGPVLRRQEIDRLLEHNRERWQLAHTTYITGFIRSLVGEGLLREITLAFPRRPETIYVYGNPSTLAIAAGIRPKAYLCHHTAVRLHGLSGDNSKTIYTNVEQRPILAPDGPLLQHAIDRAFRTRQRVTKYRAKLGSCTLVIVNGKHTDRLGVVNVQHEGGESLDVTGLERTLIDIAVRPAYAGGPSNVLAAYRKAKDRLSVEALADTLTRLEYVYPYRQAIGFYLDRAGCSPQKLERFREPAFTHDFYLDYAIKNPTYSKNWRLYVPARLR